MIDELKELIGLVTVQKVSQIEILTESEDLTTKSSKLFEAVRDGSIESDDDAMELLYPEGNSVAYKKLKSRLYKRLLNTLFFIDIKKNRKGKAFQKKDEVYKEYCQIMLIAGQDRMTLAVKMGIRLLEKSIKYETYNVSLLLCNFLEEYYAVWNPDKRLLEKYREKYKEQLQKIQELRQVTPIWTELASLLMTKRSNSLDVSSLELFETKLNRMESVKSEASSFLFNYRLYSSWIFYSWLKQDYQEQLAKCSEALEYLDQTKKRYSLHGLSIINYRGIAEMNLQKYHLAEETLTSIFNEFPITPGKTHWYNIFNYLFLVKILLKKYQDASKMMSEVVHQRNFSKQDQKWREPWLIKEAYINLLIKIGKIRNEDLVDVKLRKFRFSKFVNEVPLYFKDKRGLNVSILIAQFIYLLVENKTDTLHDRLDGLKQYSYRYLRNDSTFRSNCFIKMLLKIPGAGFHPVRVENHTKELKKKLLSTPMMISEQSYEVEIIPYEDLWEIVMETLHKRNKKGKISL